MSAPAKAKTATERMQAARVTSHRMVYERNMILALLAECYDAHLAKVSDEANPDRHFNVIVCFHTPKGQIGWKITDEALPLFRHLPWRDNHWDGHTTADKLKRLRALVESVCNTK